MLTTDRHQHDERPEGVFQFSPSKHQHDDASKKVHSLAISYHGIELSVGKQDHPQRLLTCCTLKIRVARERPREIELDLSRRRSPSPRHRQAVSEEGWVLRTATSCSGENKPHALSM